MRRFRYRGVCGRQVLAVASGHCVEDIRNLSGVHRAWPLLAQRLRDVRKAECVNLHSLGRANAPIAVAEVAPLYALQIAEMHVLG